MIAVLDERAKYNSKDIAADLGHKRGLGIAAGKLVAVPAVQSTELGDNDGERLVQPAGWHVSSSWGISYPGTGYDLPVDAVRFCTGA